MSYNLRTPARNIDAVFGSAYPALSLNRDQKCTFLSHVLAGKTGCTAAVYIDADFNRQRDIRIGIDSKGRYDIDILVDEAKGYNIAIVVEKWIDTVPTRKRRNLFQFLRRPKHVPPVDSYLITSDKSFEVFKWLNDNCKYG
jgi:hypothetical protein